MQKKINVEKNTILEILAADGQNFDMGSWTRTGTIKVSKSVTGMELKRDPEMDDNASRKTQRIAKTEILMLMGAEKLTQALTG